MSDKNFQQRNDKKHRKLVRSPEKLSPCDFDPLSNPSLLSTSSKVFINATNQHYQTTKNLQNSRSSPTKCCYNDQFPPQQQQQQVLLNNNDSTSYQYQQQQQSFPISTLPPSSSTPSIALYRKPSITIKYSKDDDLHKSPSPSSSSPSLSHRQQISKSIDSNHPFIMPSSTISEMKDQMSNNFLINFPGLYNPNSSSSIVLSSSLTNNQQQQKQQQLNEKILSPFNYNNDEFNSSSNVYSSTTTTSCDIYHQSKSSQSSLNLNLINQQQYAQYIDGIIMPSSTTTTTSANIPTVSSSSSLISSSFSMPMNQHHGSGQIVFNSNNPFLNENFDAITNDVGDGSQLDNFFNIDDSNDTELLFMPDNEITATNTPSTIIPTTTISSSSVSTILMKENHVENSHEEAQLLKNKREKFSNASPNMKICLVVSPPTNKIFQLKSKSLTHLDRIQPQINISSNDINDKNINGGHENGTSNSISAVAVTSGQNAKFTTALSCAHQSDSTNTNCVTNNEATISRNDSSTITTITSAHNESPIISSSSSTNIKKKSSSFLHRDYNRKPILARSQVSSSEYFSVCFDTENGFKDKDEIFIAATKGIALGDSLRQAMLQRSLSFSRISVIDYGMNNSNELGIPQYFGPLNIGVDIGVLAGHSLLVTEKENVQKKSGHYVLKKANSVGYRTTASRLFTSSSTEETCLETNDTTKVTKQTKQRLWSLQLFGVKNPQQNQLCELLNTYTKNGVPKSKSSYINSEYSEEALEALYGLPQSWRDFVNACDISETDTKIQSAIWELVTTEVDYIHAIQTVTDLFLSCLEGIQSENLLKDIDQHKLFSNIRDIVDANLKLWSLYFYPMVKHSMLTGHLMCIDYFQQGFTNFACIFEPYTKYCAEQVLCQNYCKDLNRNNALFTSYLAWCESQKECNRLRLADILVRPMQRLTKYNLLLSAIRKHLTEETETEIMDNMIHSVDEFVISVNSHLTTRQENERLKGIMARIESYDVVDSNNENLEKLIKQYSQMFDLCAPMKGCVVNQGRYLFLEGDMKYKDNVTKVDVHAFLLTDILLICKQTAKKGHGNLKVIRQPFMTDRLVIKLKEKENALHCVYLNDFNMVIGAFILQCNEAKNWYDGITKARHIFVKLKQGTFVDAQGHSVKVPQQQQQQQQQHCLLNNHSIADSISIRKSPLGSSIVSSLNNSHSGSVELNESKTVSVDFDKTNSISSDEGSYNLHKAHSSSSNRKLRQTSSNSLTVQSFSTHLNQSMPNLTSGPYHINSHNTLLVPGAPKSHSAHSSHSGNLLSPSQRGISYPPPSPTRATLRRGFAFSSSMTNKNPPLIKSRNVTSQSFNWTQQQSSVAAAAQLQQQQQQQMLASAGTASSNLQAQPSQIQVVYEPVEQSKEADATNRPEMDATRNET